MMTEPTSPDAGKTFTTPKDLKKRLKASYDALAIRYNEWTRNSTGSHNTGLLYTEKLLSRLALPTRTSTISILELGCGAGIPGTSKLLTHPNVHITANDLSTTQISLAKENLKNGPHGRGSRVSFIQSDMMKLDLPIQAFDAVVALYSIIHLPREEQAILIKKVVKWLKPGGYLLANFTKEDVPGREMNKWLGEEDGWMFWAGLGVEETLELLESAGLRVEVKDLVDDGVDAEFLWVLGKRPGGDGQGDTEEDS